MFVQGLGLATGDQFLDGVDESYCKYLQAVLREQLEVHVELDLFHGLIQLRHLLDDVLVEAHKNRIGVDGLVDGFHLGVAEGILIELPTLNQQVDKLHNVGIHGEEIAVVWVR